MKAEKFSYTTNALFNGKQMTLSTGEILAVLKGAELLGPQQQLTYRRVGTDTRADCSDGLFVALVGERFDGNRFLSQARAAGAAGAVIGPSALENDLPGDLRSPGTTPAEPEHRPTLRELRDQWLTPLEREYLTNLLRECEGNVAQAAGLAGVNKVTLYRLLKKHELRLTRGIK